MMLSLRDFARKFELSVQNWWRRNSSLSVVDAVLYIALFGARAYGIFVGAWLASWKTWQWPEPNKWFVWLLTLALVYIAIQPYLRKQHSEKWEKEEVRRNQVLGVCLSDLTSAVKNHTLKPEIKQQIMGSLLRAMMSEVEALTGDRDGIYLNVSLLIDNNDELTVVCRANSNRSNASYKKSELLITKAITSGRRLYVPDCNFADKEYKAILAVPLYVHAENCRKEILGCVSIDSSRPGFFDGKDEAIEIRLLPYLGLLKLAIIAEEELKRGKWR